MTRLADRPAVPVLVFAILFAVVSLFISNSYYQLMMTLVLVWAVLGLSWNLLSGYTGLISFGHAAFFGIGAYTTALGQIYFDITPWLLIPIGALFGGLSGLLIGFPTLRLQGHYFALAMLAYPLAILYVFEWLGFQEVTLPIKRVAPFAYMQFSDGRVYTLVALAFLVGTALLTQYIEGSRFGQALRAIKQNAAAAEAAGINTFAWKLKAITLSGAIASGIGAFYAVVLLVVTPQSVFGMLVSAQALTVAMFGGIGTVWGPIIGAAILIPLAEVLQAQLGARLPGIQGVIFGIAIIAMVLIAPEGLFWAARDGLRKRRVLAPVRGTDPVRPGPATLQAGAGARAVVAGEVILDVRAVSRSFAGLQAVRAVSFQLQRGAILGIIGPNGAGKTTLFNLLNGFLRPDSGTILLEGRDMTGCKPHVLCAAGVGRTFQVMRPFLRMSIADNVIVGAYVRARTDAQARSLAAAAIERVGLTAIAHRVAAELTTKELRLMELARALASQPKILLLDETLAGLGVPEADEVVAVIRRLAAEGVTVVIIEHTMQSMVRLVDRFVVLDHGAVLVEGVPESITQDPRVIEAYLGRKWLHHAQH